MEIKLREMVSLLDMAPTLLDICKIEIPDEMQGKSILGILNGRKENCLQEIPNKNSYELDNLIHSEAHRLVCECLSRKLKNKMAEAGEADL